MRRQSRKEAIGNFGSILGKLTLIVVSLIIVFNVLSDDEGQTQSNHATSANQTGAMNREGAERAEDVVEVVKDYKQLNYKDIARQKDGMTGKHIYIDGKVVQSYESWGNVILRVASFNNNNEIFYVTFPETVLDFNLLEDDYVIIKGTLAGLKTYKALLGNQVTLPEVQADSIELQ